MLKDSRLQPRVTQKHAAGKAGISQSAWSRLELGDPRASVTTWGRAAVAVGGSLEAYIRRASAAGQPRDAVHLRHQELIIRIATAGGWQALPEEPIDRDARTSRGADVLLRRLYSRPGRANTPERAEYALVEIWDWFDDVGAPIRAWTSRLAAVDRYAVARMRGDESLPRTGGCWVVRATHRNRALVHDHGHFFHARFPGSSQAWLRALSDRTAEMPIEPALVWVSVKGDRLFPARIG